MGDIIDGPLVRIIIPAFERASLFEVSLLSAINQTYRNIEVFVLDNSESDAVYEVAKKYENYSPRVVFKKNRKNIGARANMQKAFEVAGGDYFMVLTSDTVLKSEFVERAVCKAEMDGRIDVVFAASLNFPLDDNKDLLERRNFEHKTPNGAARGRMYWLDSGVMKFEDGLILAAVGLQAFFNYGIPPSCSGFGVLIRTEFFAGIGSQIFFDVQSNGGEYRHAIKILTYAEYIYFIAEELSFGPEHAGRLKKPPLWFREWEKIKVIEELFDEDKRILILKGVKPDQVSMVLQKRYEKYSETFRDSPLVGMVARDLTRLKCCAEGYRG